ncbi:MAG: hypothetical protein KatS3mg028_1292 [Bacteroidia bacterium]|nr:MAG: hypothetical protein KatS3mg028_1292 [Bacteroidia bacterium]
MYAQLEHLHDIQQRRIELWNRYYDGLKNLQEKEVVKLPILPDYATNNAHMFYLVCRSLEERTKLIEYLKSNGIQAVFHYLSLHQSPFYKDKHDGRELPNADMFSDCLVRLPMYYDLSDENHKYIIDNLKNFFNK